MTEVIKDICITALNQNDRDRIEKIKLKLLLQWQNILHIRKNMNKTQGERMSQRYQLQGNEETNSSMSQVICQIQRVIHDPTTLAEYVENVRNRTKNKNDRNQT